MRASFLLLLAMLAYVIIRTGGALRPISVVCSVWRQLERRIQLRFQDFATVHGHRQRHRRLLRA